MTGVTIRRLLPADLPAYKDLRDEVLTAHPEAFTSDAAPERSPESYLSRLGLDRPASGDFTLGAWAIGRLVGAVSCERDQRAKVVHISHVIGMMVRGNVQGKGVGRSLVDACIARARASRGMVLLTLNVTASNTTAVHLYESVGFKRHGRLERVICVDGVYYTKDAMSLPL